MKNIIFSSILVLANLWFSAAFAAEGNLNFELKNKTLTSQMAVFSKIYNKPVIINSNVVNQKLTLSAKSLTVEEAKNVISKALSLTGISVIETENDVAILAAKDAVKSGIEVFKNTVENPLPERMATLIIDLPKNLSAVEMEKSLRSMYSRNGDMKIFGEKNQLIITDWTSNLIRFQNIIAKSKR